MQVYDAINRRRSIRKFTGELPDQERLDAIIKAGQKAPVAEGKYQSYHMTVLTNKDLLDQINTKAV
jgi:nitroreductase